MKKTLVALSLVSALVLSSCLAGPKQLARSVDDWDQKLYVEQPWVDAILNAIPVIPIAGMLAGFVDFFTDNAYYFWFKDAWDGKGTGFKHYEVPPVDGQLESMLIPDAKFFEVR